jgi:tight adherence protein C
MSPVLLLSVIGVAAAVAAAAYALLSQLEERQVVRQSLRQLEGYDVEDQREQQLLDPLQQRALAPLLEGMSGLGKRLTPAGYVEKIRLRFTMAGMPEQSTIDRFMAIRVGTVVAAVVAFLTLFVLNLFDLSGVTRLGLPGFVIMALVLGPDSWLNRKVEERQHEIQVSLPDVLDLLVISVEAGLGFEQAMDRVVGSVDGPLSEEFSRMLGETRAGAARAEAMRTMDERCQVPELRSFVMSIIQADTFGVSIGRVLRAQAEEMRIKRRQIAQEKAQKAPVKMLIPMVFCIFPALFCVVLGPAIIQIMEGL